MVGVLLTGRWRVPRFWGVVVAVSLLFPVSGWAASDGYREDPLDLINSFDETARFTLGDQLWDVWLCRVPGGHAGAWRVGDLERLVGEMSEGMVSYFDWLSQGRFDPRFRAAGMVEVERGLEIGRFAYDPECSAAVELMYEEERIRGKDWAPARNGIIVVDKHRPGWRSHGGPGGAYYGSTGFPNNRADYYPSNGRQAFLYYDERGAVFDDSGIASDRFAFVTAHEMGHVLNWPHSFVGTRQTPFDGQYNNEMDMMSASPSLTATIAVNRYAAGWIDPVDVEVYRGGRVRYTLRFIGEEGTQMLVLPSETPGDYLLASARSNTGYDSGLSQWGVETYEIEQACRSCYGLRRRAAQYPVTIDNRYGSHVHGVGESAIYGNVELSVIDELDGGYVVEVGPPSSEDYFTDDEGAYELAIDALASRGFLDNTECGKGRICPGEVMERWVMAVWLVRVLEDVEPFGLGFSFFADVDTDEWWAPYVDRLGQLGVTKGCATGPARFCPHDPVTRAQMATFLNRTFDLEPGPDAGFVDIGGNSHADSINALAQANITRGCATNRSQYCPEQSVTREQMATFLARALKLIPLPPAVRKSAIAAGRIVYTRPGVGLFVADSSVTIQQSLLRYADHRSPVLSPDGARIAFHSGRDGGDEVFVMDVDGSDLRQLTRNEWDDRDPVWSPDGTRIAFHSGRDGGDEVFVMDVDGSDLRQLTRNEWDDRSPVWSPDGTRIAFIRSGVGIFVMDAEGSDVLRIPGGKGWDTGPTWSSDSENIAFLRRNVQNGEWDIFVAAPDGSHLRQLTHGGGWSVDPVWSPDGKRIAFTRHDGWSGDREIYAMNSDGTNQKQLTDNDSEDETPVWSPDSSRIAFVRDGGWSGANLWVMNADGDNQQRITDLNRFVINSLAWSTDSIQLVYSSGSGPSGLEGYYADGRTADNIFVVNADGSNQEQLTVDNQFEPGDTPVFSPDGDRIAFNNNGYLYVMNANGSNQQRIATIGDWQGVDPVWSPDGTLLAFTKYGSIFVVEPDGSNERQLTTTPDVQQNVFEVVWSPDGDRIAFTPRRNVLSLEEFEDLGDPEISVVNADGTDQVQLTDNRRWESNLVWSPDSTRIAFEGGAEGPVQIFAMDPDGRNERQLTRSDRPSQNPVFSPDGSRIVFTRGSALYGVDAEGGNEKPITPDDHWVADPVWSPDGTQIAYQSTHLGGPRIYVINADGTNPTQITFQAGWNPIWLPGG